MKIIRSRNNFFHLAYFLKANEMIDREFNAFSPIKNASSKYVLSLDKIDMSKNGITHLNIIDFLENQVDLFLS